MGRTSRWHGACRKVKIEEAHCSSRQDGIGVALSLFYEVNNLEVEEELSTLATLVSRWEDEGKSS